MATVYDWGVRKVMTAPQQGDLVNVVRKIYWDCSVIEDDNIFANVSGKTTVSYDGGSFINFDDLTEASVLAWVWDSANGFKDSIEAKALSKLNEQKAPALVSKQLPWS